MPCTSVTAVVAVLWLITLPNIAAAVPTAVGAAGNASQYSVLWQSLLPEPGKNKKGRATFLNSMPLGNGHVAANILYDSETSAIVALVSASSAWAESGELIKV